MAETSLFCIKQNPAIKVVHVTLKATTFGYIIFHLQKEAKKKRKTTSSHTPSSLRAFYHGKFGHAIIVKWFQAHTRSTASLLTSSRERRFSTILDFLKLQCSTKQVVWRESAWSDSSLNLIYALLFYWVCSSMNKLAAATSYFISNCIYFWSFTSTSSWFNLLCFCSWKKFKTKIYYLLFFLLKQKPQKQNSTFY